MKPNIISLKYLLPLIFLVIGLACQCSAQNNKKVDNNNYDSIIKKISVLNHFDLKKYDSLTVINKDTVNEHIHPFQSSGTNDELIGWLVKESNDSINLLELSGIEISINKEKIKSIRTLGINDSLTDIIKFYSQIRRYIYIYWDREDIYDGDSFMPRYLVSLWLYQKGNKQAAYKLLQASGYARGWSDLNAQLSVIIEKHFGNLYYNSMLVAYAIDRDYAKAIQYGSYFNYADYKNFYYTKTAIELTTQLKQRKDDFKSFCIPDSLSWIKLKLTMDRKEQFIYLAERLRLLNCEQHGQPGDINFHDPQIAGTKYIDLLYGYKVEKWQSLKVINPYNELLAMKPKISEVETLLPYLNDTSFIPAYHYFRDFYYLRKLYRLNDVIEDLIFHITNVHFFQIDSFNCLTADKKKLEIEKIRDWCTKNNSLSKEELNRKILSETGYWDAFENAMDTAVMSGDTSVISTLIRRNNELFRDNRGELYAHKWKVAEAIYSLGSVRDTGTMISWFKNTDDYSVKMWTSLFLMKNDKEYYEKAFDTLSNILKNKGYDYEVIKPLISFKNERTLKLAEGIFKLHCFKIPVNYIEHKDQVKLLFLAKSEVAFKFLYNGLMNLDTTLYSRTWNLNGNEFRSLYCDPYIEVIDNWRASNKHINWDWDVQKRRKYSKKLAHWLKKQFELICADKKNQIII